MEAIGERIIQTRLSVHGGDLVSITVTMFDINLNYTIKHVDLEKGDIKNFKMCITHTRQRHNLIQL